MITVAEIRRLAAAKYPDFLQASLRGELFFPLDIRFGKAKASDDYLQLRQWVQALLAASKAQVGYGYEVTLRPRQLRRYGEQSLPERISFPTAADYLQFLGREGDFAAWEAQVGQTLAQFPQLHGWLVRSPLQMVPYAAVWEALLLVCAYWVARPRPGCYARELPLPVHTKFIEEHQGILRSLLDWLLPEEAIAAAEKRFEPRFGLRYDEPQIRMRLLSEPLRQTIGWPAADLTFTLSDAAQLHPLAGKTVFIVENKMSFLTLPMVADGVAIWGKGFQAAILGQLAWLAACPIWYWGDLDVHGLAILGQVRGARPQTRALLMDEATLAAYEPFVVKGVGAVAAAVPHLTPDEQALYQHLASHTLRLEQERIPQAAVNDAIRRCLE